MMRRTNRIIIDTWIDRNGPGGLEKLAIQAGVSGSLISHARSSGIAPKKSASRLKLARFLRVTEDELFPPSKAGKRAS